MKCLLCGKELKENAKVLGIEFHEMESLHTNAHIKGIAIQLKEYIQGLELFNKIKIPDEIKKAIQDHDFIQRANILERK